MIERLRKRSLYRGLSQYDAEKHVTLLEVKIITWGHSTITRRGSLSGKPCTASEVQ